MVAGEVERLAEEQFRGAPSADRYSMLGVQLPGDGDDRLLDEVGEFHALGEALAQQAVGDFVDGGLPRAVGVGEESFDLGADVVVLVAGYLPVSEPVNACGMLCACASPWSSSNASRHSSRYGAENAFNWRALPKRFGKWRTV